MLQKGDTADPKFIFHPIRYCQIVDAIDNPGNASFTYNLKLRECISYQYDSSRNDTFIQTINDEITPQITEKINDLQVYFRELTLTTKLSKATIDTTDTWLNLVRHLGRLTIFEKTIFFRLISSPGIDFKETDLQLPKPKKLQTGKLYNLNFLLIAGSKVKGSGVYPEIETGDNITTQGPFIKQDSNAIALRYVLITGNASSRQYSSFTIKVKPEPTTTSPASPEITTYLLVRPRVWVGFFAVIVILLGLIAPSLTDLLPKDKIYLLAGGLQVKGSNFVVYTKIIVSIIAGIMTFIIYKKLPKAE